jgi:uncharacterized protein (DUF433 family)
MASPGRFCTDDDNTVQWNSVATVRASVVCGHRAIIQRMATPTTNPTTAAAAPSLADYIVKTPGVCSGQPRIAGTRIKVKHVYTWVERSGMTPAQVVAEYPQLTRAQVHAALAYYWSHQEEIQQDIADEENLVADLKAQAGSSRLRERLAELHGQDDPLPPG